MLYKPSQISEIIGPAKQYAALIEHYVAQCKLRKETIRLLILGPPGCGKSTLSHFAVKCIGTGKWSTRIMNGTELKIEEVEEIAHWLRIGSLYGDYNVLQVEEVDAVPIVAQTRFLTLMDQIPWHSSVICTSNCSVTQLEARFGGRFKNFEIKPPSDVDIEALLIRLGTPAKAARHHAVMACGDVRRAIENADTSLLMASMPKAA